MSKEKFKWDKKTMTALRKTRELWQDREKKWLDGNRIILRYDSFLVWEKTGRLFFHRCPLCKLFYQCFECPYHLIYGKPCIRIAVDEGCSVGHYERFERNPTLGKMQRIIQVIDRLIGEGT